MPGRRLARMPATVAAGTSVPDPDRNAHQQRGKMQMNRRPKQPSVIVLTLLLSLLAGGITSRSAHSEVQGPLPLPLSEVTPPGDMEIGVYGGRSHVELHPYVEKQCCGDGDCFVSKIRLVKGNPGQYEAYFQEPNGSCPRWCTIWLGVSKRQSLPNGLSAVCSRRPPACGCPRTDQFYCIYPGEGG
jgi:hypothetical protein